MRVLQSVELGSVVTDHQAQREDNDGEAETGGEEQGLTPAARILLSELRNLLRLTLALQVVLQLHIVKTLLGRSSGEDTGQPHLDGQCPDTASYTDSALTNPLNTTVLIILISLLLKCYSEEDQILTVQESLSRPSLTSVDLDEV